MSALLATQNLTRRFGGLTAVDGVSIEIEAGRVHALIGPNGAGKSTLVSLISGRLKPDEGSVHFAGEDITRLNVAERMRLGIGYTFQITRIFASLDPVQHVLLGLPGGGDSRAERQRAIAWLDEFGLAAWRTRPAGTLSHGHQRLLELAMVTFSEPRLLLLDEPTQGLSDGEIEQFITRIESLAATSTLLLIEHNMNVVMRLADTITVLNQGRELRTATPEVIRNDREVQRAYLGTPR